MAFGIAEGLALGSLLLGAGTATAGAVGAANANKRGVALAREQMKWQEQQTDKQRKWQEDVYNRYNSATAQAAQYRAAGLNSQLMNASPQSISSSAMPGTVGMPQIQNEYSALNGLAGNALSAAQTYSDSQLKSSQQDVNDSLSNLQDTQSMLNNTNVESMRLNVDLMRRTFDDQVSSYYLDNVIKKWNAYDVEADYRRKMFALYNIDPEQVNNLQKQSLAASASAFKLMADGKLTLRQLDNYMQEFSLRQYEAVSGRINANSAALNASTSQELMRHQSGYLDAQSGEISRRNQSYDLPVSYKGADGKIHQTKAGNHLQYLLINQNRAALKTALQNPQLIKSQIYMNEGIGYANRINPSRGLGQQLIDYWSDQGMTRESGRTTTSENYVYDKSGKKVKTSGNTTTHTGGSYSRGSKRFRFRR